MRIEKWGFLLSYVIYLVFCIGLSIFSKDTTIINSMIFAITIASTSFSISDMFFTKVDIDKKERESLFGLYHLEKYAIKFYSKKIMKKYSKQAEEMVSILMELFKDSEDKIDKFFMGELSLEEQTDFFDTVKSYSNDELTKFVEKNMVSDISNINDMINNDETKDIEIYEVIDKQEKKEQIYYVAASAIAVLGLSTLLIALTLRLDATFRVNSVLTVIAFLSVIISLFLKEYYKVNSIKKIEQERKKVLNDLQSHIKN